AGNGTDGGLNGLAGPRPHSPPFFLPSSYPDLGAGGGEFFGGVTPAARITRCKAATVSGDGRKLSPGRWPSAIVSGVNPLLFARFQTAIRAPRSARSCTTRGWFR